MGEQVAISACPFGRLQTWSKFNKFSRSLWLHCESSNRKMPGVACIPRLRLAPDLVAVASMLFEFVGSTAEFLFGNVKGEPLHDITARRVKTYLNSQHKI